MSKAKRIKEGGRRNWRARSDGSAKAGIPRGTPEKKFQDRSKYDGQGNER